MDDPDLSSPAQTRSKTSLLLPIGIALMLTGLILPAPITRVAMNMTPGAVRSAVFISTDLFRLCFFGGVIFLVIGVIRNRNLKRLAKATAKPTEN